MGQVDRPMTATTGLTSKSASAGRGERIKRIKQDRMKELAEIRSSGLRLIQNDVVRFFPFGQKQQERRNLGFEALKRQEIGNPENSLEEDSPNSENFEDDKKGNLVNLTNAECFRLFICTPNGQCA